MRHQHGGWDRLPARAKRHRDQEVAVALGEIAGGCNKAGSSINACDFVGAHADDDEVGLAAGLLDGANMPVVAWSLIAVTMIGTPAGMRPRTLLVWVKLSSSVFLVSMRDHVIGSGKSLTAARKPASWPSVRIVGMAPDCGRSPRMK